MTETFMIVPHSMTLIFALLADYFFFCACWDLSRRKLRSLAMQEVMIRFLTHANKVGYLPKVATRIPLSGISYARLFTIYLQNVMIRRALRHNGIEPENLVTYSARKLVQRPAQFVTRPNGARIRARMCRWSPLPTCRQLAGPVIVLPGMDQDVFGELIRAGHDPRGSDDFSRAPTTVMLFMSFAICHAVLAAGTSDR